jgi:hypothetical protein
MKIAWFKREINPELGTGVAGYDFSTKSTVIHDNLYMTGLCMDDGENKALIISFDLLALDGWYIRNLQKECAEILDTRPEMILFSCTHNHSGPEAATPIAPNHDKLNVPFTEKLHDLILEETKKLKDFRECDVTFYSSKCDENRNRRYTTADNVASFTPHRREVVPLATEYADKELGQLCFFDAQSGLPVYVIGNYAAHPLAGHTPGLGMARITADYPGFFRDYITAETGAESMFISGACGDLVPREDELGMDAARGMGVRLAKAAIGGIIDSRRNRNRFTLKDPRLGGNIKSFTVPIRKKFQDRVPPEYKGKSDVTLEIQTLAVGDICFVGMPGEVCCELGQEIKWHSPFRKAFIAYYATSDFSYMAPANFLVSGGYEGSAQQFGSMGGFELVRTAIDSMFSLHRELFPDPEGEEPYPDNLNQPLVDIPKN